MAPDHHFPVDTTTSDEHLWRPGSTSYPRPARETIDPLRREQELHKLYEDTSESSYDLSLKDIVDPSYSISGNLKAIVAKVELTSDVRAAGQNRSRKGEVFSSIPKLSFPGLRGKRRSPRPTLYARTISPSHPEEKQPSGSKHRQPSASKRSVSADRSPPNPHLPYLYASSPESRAFSTSRVHPSNQCSACSSYTIFFKCRCVACGRLYCSNCAKHYTVDNLSDGRKCKDPACNSRLLSRRFSSCWPFCGTFRRAGLEPQRSICASSPHFLIGDLTSTS